MVGLDPVCSRVAGRKSRTSWAGALLVVSQVVFWALGDNCSRKQEIHSGFVPVGPSEDKERASVVPKCHSTSSALANLPL